MLDGARPDSRTTERLAMNEQEPTAGEYILGVVLIFGCLALTWFVVTWQP